MPIAPSRAQMRAIGLHLVHLRLTCATTTIGQPSPRSGSMPARRPLRPTLSPERRLAARLPFRPPSAHQADSLTRAIVSGGRLTALAAEVIGTRSIVPDPAATRYSVAERGSAPVRLSETSVVADSDSLASTTSTSPVAECRDAKAATREELDVARSERSPNVAPRPSKLRYSRNAAPAGLSGGGNVQYAARSTPERPKIPSASASATAPLASFSPPKLYSLIASPVPG